jgi:hypothetical protein
MESDDKVVNMTPYTPRAALQKMIDLLDSGVVSNFIIVAQGYDEEEGHRTMVPMSSGNLTLSDICVAAAILDQYRSMSVNVALVRAEAGDA